MKKAIALRHIHFEDLGTLHAEFASRGYEVQYVDPSIGELDTLDLGRADLLVVLGGPIGAYDEALYPFVAQELAAVRRWLDSGKPLLGICLGAQLIVRALGARVYPLGVKEIGFSPLTLTDAGLASPLAKLDGVPVLHWHGDQFDIPEGAVHLAGTAIGANQAFAVGTQVLGLQFHLEADAARLERWLVGHACELGVAQVDPRTLRADAQKYGGLLTLAARDVLVAWLTNLERSR